MKICDFWQTVDCISETVQDGDRVAVEHDAIDDDLD